MILLFLYIVDIRMIYALRWSAVRHFNVALIVVTVIVRGKVARQCL